MKHTDSIANLLGFADIAQDILLFKSETAITNKTNVKRAYFEMDFISKALDKCMINSLFHKKEVKEMWPTSLPHNTIHWRTPMVSFKYCTTLGSKILNYRQTIYDDDVRNIINRPYTCNCRIS